MDRRLNMKCYTKNWRVGHRPLLINYNLIFVLPPVFYTGIAGLLLKLLPMSTLYASILFIKLMGCPVCLGYTSASLYIETNVFIISLSVEEQPQKWCIVIVFAVYRLSPFQSSDLSPYISIEKILSKYFSLS